MKKLALLALVITLAGCLGYTSKDNGGIGQIKAVHSVTPIICPDYTYIDVSLGVMQGGVGSMSNHDMKLYVSSENTDLIARLDSIQKTGAIVDITYDVLRLSICTNDHRLTSVTPAKQSPVVAQQGLLVNDSLAARVTNLEKVVMGLLAEKVK
jgi:hypothetical protein